MTEENEVPEVGHNSGARLVSILERIEKLEEEKRELANDIKDIKAEAKGTGFDVPTINEMLKLRRMSADKRNEKEELRDLYMNAIGLI